MTTTTTFDVDALRDAIESADAEGQLRHYADDAEVTLVDRDNPPSKPIRLRGKDEIRGWLDDLCGRDMTHSVSLGLAGERSGGYSLHCRYPSGERVACAALFEIDGGRIVRLEGVQAWDA
ncbi:MAG: hypothetical protein QOG63_2842 [Thermoleophilaceae bacterium]|jgi:hypothetical protein|nr:hypothetical protein [Thermoleophilaceae bacterium]